MKRLLVTGVSGLLGLNLACMAQGRFDVVGVLRGGRAAVSPGHTPFGVIVSDLQKPGEARRVIEMLRPDAVINCAAMTDVDACEDQAEEAFRANAELPQALAAAAARSGAQLLHISTDAVFDGKRGDYRETDEPSPVNIYAQSKLAGERAVADEYPDALIARVNFYGWSWQGQRSLSEWFFKNLSEGRSINGFTDLTFCPLLVNDLVEILLRMIDRRLSGLYHVVSPECLSKFEFGRMIARQFGFREELVAPALSASGGLKAPRSPNLTLRSDKLSDVLDESLPTQGPAMQRYYELYCQGFPKVLRAVFHESTNSQNY